MKKVFITLCIAASAMAAQSQNIAQTGDNIAFPLYKYNVVWNSPSMNAAGSMPIGNGDLGANVYALKNDDLYLLLGKTDAFDRSGNVLKTGRVKIHLHPNPFRDMSITQTLNLEKGCIDITGLYRFTEQRVNIRIWTDANSPVYRVEITSTHDIDLRVEPEFWTRNDGSTDKLETKGNRLLWHYSNANRSVFEEDLAYYEISEMARTHPDPYKYNTFGCAIQIPGLTPADGCFSACGRSFNIEIASLTQQTPDIDLWRRQLLALLDNYQRNDAWEKHCRWWTEFWNRSWITASDNTLPDEEREKSVPPASAGVRAEKDGGFIVAQSYNVSRYIMACQGRGRYQAQFNGGIFTTPFPNYRAGGNFMFNEDERDWGNRFTFQNQRLLYWFMPNAGDLEMMRPFFNYYLSILDLRKAITKAWFGHEGAYWRENTQLTGREIDDASNYPPLINGKPPKTEKGKPLPPGWYHNYHFNSGMELAAMALEYYLHTGSAAFLSDTLAPLAREALLFYVHHYDKDNKGKLYFYPSQVLETWWDAANPMPDVAGMHYLVSELLKIKDLSKDDRKLYEQIKKQMPDLPIGDENGKKFMLPAATYKKEIRNSENGELYAAFPYPVFGVVAGNPEIVAETMERRANKNAIDYRCWTQDQIHYACAGMGKEAAHGLVHRWEKYSENLRFPFFGKERPDYVPDLDHNGSGCIALQKMIVQETDNKIFLLPAWNPEWDANFKLRLRHNTVIQGIVKNGKLQSWSITPESRKKDVKVMFTNR
ncbi:MAG: DUF5703 domain-containing protein [Prevotellaceae bacterium]|jgi:hypothetical protein|nr:DUF5703 domain-containing protein [Prevotellaceae bacterium]